MKWFKYKLIWYVEHEEKDETAYGIVCGASYAEAMTNIEKQFGDTLESIEHMEMFCDYECYDLTEEQYNSLESTF